MVSRFLRHKPPIATGMSTATAASASAALPNQDQFTAGALERK